MAARKAEQHHARLPRETRVQFVHGVRFVADGRDTGGGGGGGGGRRAALWRPRVTVCERSTHASFVLCLPDLLRRGPSAGRRTKKGGRPCDCTAKALRSSGGVLLFAACGHIYEKTRRISPPPHTPPAMCPMAALTALLQLRLSRLVLPSGVKSGSLQRPRPRRAVPVIPVATSSTWRRKRRAARALSTASAAHANARAPLPLRAQGHWRRAQPARPRRAHTHLKRSGVEQ